MPQLAKLSYLCLGGQALWSTIAPEDPSLPESGVLRHPREMRFTFRTMTTDSRWVYPTVLQWLCDVGRTCPRLRRVEVFPDFALWLKRYAAIDLERPRMLLSTMTDD